MSPHAQFFCIIKAITITGKIGRPSHPNERAEKKGAEAWSVRCQEKKKERGALDADRAAAESFGKTKIRWFGI